MVWAAKYLQEEQHKVIYINASARDYVEDSFLLIASEIVNKLQKNKGKIGDLKKESLFALKALLPIGIKVLLNILS